MSKSFSPEIPEGQSTPSRLCHPVRSSRGSALLISLVFVILISIVLVGFVTTAMLERKSTPSHGAKFEAELLNTMAVEIVASRLSLITSGTSWWASQPGRIAYGTTGTMTLVDLSSGSASGSGSDASVNLNIPSLTQSTGLIVSSTATIMPVSWIYVRESGTQTLTGSGTNPRVVGRYAFWTDDGSSRINVNAAASRKAPNSELISHPSRIDLSTLPMGNGTLPSTDVQKIRIERDTRPFGSVGEMAGVGGGPNANISQAISENKESLTHYNHSPEYGLNQFGEPKIVLTTYKNRAGGRPYLEITTADNIDPGPYTNVDLIKVEQLFAKLYPYFTKSAAQWGLSINPDTVGFSGKKFTDTYQYNTTGAAQIILNLIDYVRSMESSEAIVLPLRGSFSGNTYSSLASANSQANAIEAHARALQIVEIGVWFPPVTVENSGTHSYQAKVKMRVFSPPLGLTGFELAGRFAQIEVNQTGVPLEITPRTTNAEPVTAANFSESTDIGKTGGQYRTLTFNFPIVVPSANARPTRPLSIRVALKAVIGGTSYDRAPVRSSGGTSPGDISYRVDGATVTEADMTSVSVDDPALGQSRSDWTVQGPNTFGTQNRPNASTLGTPIEPPSDNPGQPQQDGDENGNRTNASLAFPVFSGSSIIGSVGELGKVHTGGKGVGKGIPWRSLRLQPRANPTFSLPDWLLLDLFAVPYQAKNPADPADEAALRPSTNTLGGRINLNQRAYPFSTSQFNRLAPMRTLLQSIKPALTGTSVDGLVDNIINHTVATGLPNGSTGLQFGNAQFVSSGLYQFPGEISEIQGLTQKGEEDEALIRSMVAHLTTRGNVFTVYSVGQKLQQLTDGSFKVLAESRTATTLERYEELDNNGVANGTWKIRVVSTKELGL